MYQKCMESSQMQKMSDASVLSVLIISRCAFFLVLHCGFAYFYAFLHVFVHFVTLFVRLKKLFVCSKFCMSYSFSFLYLLENYGQKYYFVKKKKILKLTHPTRLAAPWQSWFSPEEQEPSTSWTGSLQENFVCSYQVFPMVSAVDWNSPVRGELVTPAGGTAGT